MGKKLAGAIAENHNKNQHNYDQTEDQREMEKETADLDEVNGDEAYEKASSADKLKYEDEFQILHNAYDAY